MSRSIQVGDTVRRINTPHDYGLGLGAVGVVDQIRVDDRIHIKGEMPDVVHKPANLELVEEAMTFTPKEGMPSKFKVGDRVRDISKHAEIWGLPEHQEGTIESRDTDGTWNIDWDNKNMGPLNWRDDQIALVEPTEALPVRVVTKQEIVPGEYGAVSVRRYERDPADHIRVSLFNQDEMYRCLDAAELRAAARVFNSLAEALEGQQP